jgi:phosphoserine phosphatase
VIVAPITSAPSSGHWGLGYFGYRYIFFDCDSTLSRIEGVDELARLKGVADEVARLTRQAMNGDIKLEMVYAERLRLLTPTRGEMRALARHYVESVVEDARELIAALSFLQRQVFIISGGLAPAVTSFGRWLGVPASHIRAVDLEFDQLVGMWWDYRQTQRGENQSERYLAYVNGPLTESKGKTAVISELARDDGRRRLLVGDGASDLAARGAVDLFVGFGGVVYREQVAREAEVYITCASLAPVLPLAGTPAAFERCRGTPYHAIYEKGLSLISQGAVIFRNPGRREALIRAYREVL